MIPELEALRGEHLGAEANADDLIAPRGNFLEGRSERQFMDALHGAPECANAWKDDAG